MQAKFLNRLGGKAMISIASHSILLNALISVSINPGADVANFY